MAPHPLLAPTLPTVAKTSRAHTLLSLWGMEVSLCLTVPSGSPPAAPGTGAQMTKARGGPR